MVNIPQVDKSISTTILPGHGAIAIRVVVLEKGMAAAPAIAGDEAPVDASADEMLPETDKRPVSGFLEEAKRGKQCCVFLINGQRQHSWDNQFIVKDLELKYLRNRMIVVVECDGLKPEAIAELMQGSRHQFYEGTVYFAVESRVLATLKGDPDLRRLEEEAEDEISSLQAGDEAVKAALDQLIEAHHDAAPHATHGQSQGGAENRQEGAVGGLVQTQEVVVLAEHQVGSAATEPVLNIRPDVATIRLKPNEARRFLIYPKPEVTWKNLETMALTFDPPVKELQVTRTSQITGEEVTLKFVEAVDMDEDEYPIETVLRNTAVFREFPEPRVLERRVVVTPSKKRPRKPTAPLKDDPTFLRVSSRLPIKIVIDGPDVHVKLRWDGKDELVSGSVPTWVMRASCESPSVDPQIFLTKPISGRFELLIQAAPGLKPGEQLKFDIDAAGPGKTLTTAFLADVVEAPGPRKVATKLPGGSQRRPPYELKYVTRANWNDGTCWGEVWTGDDVGTFESPSAKSPLTIFINQDMDLLVAYREALIARKNAETTIQHRINKYTAHVAFHLYQMYLKKKEVESSAMNETEIPSEEQMRDEIRRVGRTLLKLMEVAS